MQHAKLVARKGASSSFFSKQQEREGQNMQRAQGWMPPPPWPTRWLACRVNDTLTAPLSFSSLFFLLWRWGILTSHAVPNSKILNHLTHAVTPSVHSAAAAATRRQSSHQPRIQCERRIWYSASSYSSACERSEADTTCVQSKNAAILLTFPYFFYYGHELSNYWSQISPVVILIFWIICGSHLLFFLITQASYECMFVYIFAIIVSEQIYAIHTMRLRVYETFVSNQINIMQEYSSDMWAWSGMLTKHNRNSIGVAG